MIFVSCCSVYDFKTCLTFLKKKLISYRIASNSSFLERRITRTWCWPQIRFSQSELLRRIVNLTYIYCYELDWKINPHGKSKGAHSQMTSHMFLSLSLLSHFFELLSEIPLLYVRCDVIMSNSLDFVWNSF